MNNLDIINKLPKMLSGNELITAMKILPEYDERIVQENQAIRLMALNDIYNIYVPSAMSIEIYNKLYLALLRSLQKKDTRIAIKQRYENHKAIKAEAYEGIIGGSDSFTIIGCSGIGKSSAISRAITLLTENRMIEIEKPYMKIIPCMSVQCPFDSSVKGLLIEILRKVDEELHTDYYKNAVKSRTTTDTIIGVVSQVALNHIGLLIVDEIQNVANSKNGKSLIGSLTQLINNSGISICMVGTPESKRFFEQAMQLARRSLGLKYNALLYDDYFIEFCKTVFSYQYVREKTEINDVIIDWLYEHSGGVISVVVSLIHDAQEIAIMAGKEKLGLESLNIAYQQRLSMLHDYIQPTVITKPQTTKGKRKRAVPDIKTNDVCIADNMTISELVAISKSENSDIVSLIQEHFKVEVVAV